VDGAQFQIFGEEISMSDGEAMRMMVRGFNRAVRDGALY
jgi:hypothetical protein